MGLSSSKTKTSTKPVYSAQLEGAANNVTGAYNAQAPKITNITDSMAELVPGIVKQYTMGDPNVNAAKGYNADVLSGKYLNGSPQLDALVNQTNNDVRNGLSASLGTRGLTGGSAFGDIITRGLAQNETGLRYTDYNNQMTRMDNAAAQAPGLAAAGYLPLTAIQSILQSQMTPIQAASGAGSAVGGLLGQYTNSTQTLTPSLGMLIAQIAGNAASAWGSGGFK